MYDETTLMVQFRFSKKATKYDWISQLICRLLSKFQINWAFHQNICAFLTNLNFKEQDGNLRKLWNSKKKRRVVKEKNCLFSAEEPSESWVIL